MLTATKLVYSYPEAGKRHVVLQDVSLSVASGECVALVGSSGSGKSTLLNLLGGIDKPDAGTIEIAGKQWSHLEEPGLTLYRCENIGFIYQQFNLIPTLTVAENILLPLDLLGFSSDAQQQRLKHWLGAVRLLGRGGAFPDQLSGGEQQRVAIARALIHQPALLLADEPTGNLDAQTGALILELLFELTREMGQTLLVVTHSQQVAARADRVLRLNNGELQTDEQAAVW